MNLLPEIQKRLEEKRKKLNSLRPLPPSAVKKLREQFEIEMTYNSNAIEGNSLTLKETFLVIHEGITIKNKPLKDHLEATNHKEALEYLYELIKPGQKHTISEHLIKNLHQVITQNIEKEWAGKYRHAGVRIGGAKHTPPNALRIPELMQKLINWVGHNPEKLHLVELAARAHHKLVYIHPFFDGNGRTARLFINLLLMQKGYPLSIVLKNDRKRYYQVLDQADKGFYEPLVRFIAQTVERSLDLYLATLIPSSQKPPKYISLAEASQNFRYSAKYLNLLAAQGKLEAHKTGRNWVTTKEAIQKYIKGRQRQRKK